MDTILTYIGDYTSIVEVGMVLVFAAMVMGIWQAVKSLHRHTEASHAAQGASAADMRGSGNVRLEA